MRGRRVGRRHCGSEWQSIRAHWGTSASGIGTAAGTLRFLALFSAQRLSRMGSLILQEHIMASMPFEEGSGRAQPGATMVAGYPVGRWTRYADMAAVAGLGLGLLAALFGILDYQRNVYGDMLKTE